MRVPPFQLSLGTELKVNGALMVVREVAETGRVRLECPLRKTSCYFPLQELVSMRMRGEVKPALEAKIKHLPSGEDSFRTPSREQRLRVARRIAYVSVLAPLGPMGPDNPTLIRTVAEIAERNQDTSPPSPSSVYRWVRRYRDSGFDTAALAQDAMVIRTRKRRVPQHQLELIRARVEHHLGQNVGATLNGVMDTVLAEVAKELGYAMFATKNGTELLVDEFLNRIPPHTQPRPGVTP